MILVLFLYALIALTFTIGKMLLFFVPPIFLIAVRMIISGIILLGAYLVLYGVVQFKRKRDIGLLLLITLLHIFIPYITEFLALREVTPSSAALLYNLAPFFSALFSYLYFNEEMTVRKWIGFFIGLAGILFFIKPDSWSYECVTWPLTINIPHMLLLVSVVTASLGWVFVRILVKNQGYSPLCINGFAMLLGGGAALPTSYLFEGKVALPYESGTFWFLLASIVIIANILFYNLYSILLRRYTATFLSFAGFITPLFAALYDWLIFRYTVDHRFFIAIGIVAIGIYIFYKEELDQGYILE